MSAAELLPCPFCGGKADWHNIGNEHTKSRSTKIWCSECRVTRNTGAIRHSLDWTKEHAFAAWNRRHTPSSPVSAPSPAGGVREALDEQALRAARKVYNETLGQEWKTHATDRVIEAYLNALPEPESQMARHYADKAAWRDPDSAIGRRAADFATHHAATPEPVSAPAGEVEFPAYGEISIDELGSAVKAAQFGKLAPYEFHPNFSKGHQIVGTINFNSLNRIVTWFVKRAALSNPGHGEAVR